MITKHPRSIDDPDCEWCNGTGEWEIEHPDRPTELTGGQAFHVERGPCEKCGGTGYAKFDPADLLARSRSECDLLSNEAQTCVLCGKFVPAGTPHRCTIEGNTR